MKRAGWLVIVVGLLAGCGGGFGVQNAEQQAKEAHAKEPPANRVGFSIWSMFGANRQFVRDRLGPGIGKPKSEQVARLGQPFECKPAAGGGEICGWYDPEMSDSGKDNPSAHQVFYTFDQKGVATAWQYQGIYGKLSSTDETLPVPPPDKGN